MIDELIDLINNNFDGIIDEQITLGIVQRVYRVNGDDSVDFMPGIINNDGEAIYAGIDDIRSLSIYHKLNSATLSNNPRGGYGDSKRNEDTFQGSVIACWDTRKVKLQASEMLLLLRNRMPQCLIDTQKNFDIQITPTVAILNTKQVFDSEYSIGQAGYILPLFINFLQLNYNLLIKYDQDCIEKCINCS